MANLSIREIRTRTGKALKSLRHLVFVSDDLDVLSKFHRMSVDFMRFMIVLFRETAANQIWQRASALTYTTILSLFPLLMVLSSAASIFYTEEEEERLIGWVTEQFTPQSPTVFGELMGRNGGDFDFGIPNNRDEQPSRDLTQEELEELAEIVAEDAKSPPAAEDFAAAIQELGGSYRNAAGGLGFAGLLGLFLASLLLYKSIEQAFEAAWETTHISSLKRTITGFTFLVVVAPIILGLSITITSFVVSVIGGGEPTMETPASILAGEGENATTASEPAPTPTGFRRYLLMLVPAVFNSLILSAAYMYIPQARVQWNYALLGGFIAGFLWEAAKLSFVFYIYMSTVQQALLQSLGFLPIFLIWIYFTWLVFLVGNQIVYVSQNFRRLRLHHFGPDTRTYLDGRLLLAIAMLVADSFERGKGGISHERLGMLLRVPPREFDRALGILLNRQIIELTDDGRYTMRKPSDTVYIDQLLNLGCDPVAVCSRHGLVDHPAVSYALQGIQDQILEVGKDRTLRDLLALRAKSKKAARAASASDDDGNPVPSQGGKPNGVQQG